MAHVLCVLHFDFAQSQGPLWPGTKASRDPSGQMTDGGRGFLMLWECPGTVAQCQKHGGSKEGASMVCKLNFPSP